MTSIQLTLTGAQARAEVNGLLTAGMVGVPVSITWDESWDGLVKTLVCKSDGCVRTVLNVGDQAMVAPEVLRTERWNPNSLYLGVEGRDAEGELVIPSTFAYCGQILPGAVAEGIVSQDPESPVWARILGLIGDMDDLATVRKDSLVEAINEAAGKSAQGAAGTDILASYQLSSSFSEIPTGSWSASIPEMAAGKYLWTKITLGPEDGVSNSIYSVSGGVNSVNGVQPDDKGNVALTASRVGAVPLTGGTMTGALSMVFPTASAHGANKGYVDNAVSRAAPANLLDNSDFCNPVNQRGTSGSVPAYTYFIDRWKSGTSEARSFSLLSNGMKMPAATTIMQLISSIPSGAKLTFAIELSNGDLGVLTGTTTYNSDSAWVRFATAGFEDFELYLETMNGLVQAVVYSVNEITIKWAALYEGEYTADTLPKYSPKGYGAELTECQRYCRALDYTSENYTAGFATASTTSRLNVYIPMAPPMRTTPSLSSTDGSMWAVYDSDGNVATATTASIWFASMNGLLGLRLECSSTLIVNKMYSIRYNSATKLIISADL